jgi:predicted GNAT family N-acyltransferase
MFKVVTTFDELLKAFMVRAIVFVEEQNVTFAEEVDEHEHASLHILGEWEGEPIAAARIRFLGEYAKLERICVRSKWRGKNIGRQLVTFMMAVARDRGFNKFKMHAQSHLTDFYGQFGFQVVGDLFYEANIPHYVMVHLGGHER